MRLYLAFEEAVKFPSEVAEPLAIHSSSAGKSVIPHPQQHSLNATFTLRLHLLLLTDIISNDYLPSVLLQKVNGEWN